MAWFYIITRRNLIDIGGNFSNALGELSMDKQRTSTALRRNYERDKEAHEGKGRSSGYTSIY